MPDYILLMHSDAATLPSADLWGPYLNKLRKNGAFQGGSSIGSGEVLRKDNASKAITQHLSGYIKIHVKDRADAKTLIEGNPVFEAGGSVELRELPPTDHTL